MPRVPVFILLTILVTELYLFYHQLILSCYFYQWYSTCGPLSYPDRLQHNLFQRSKPDKVALFRAIDDCYNC